MFDFSFPRSNQFTLLGVVVWAILIVCGCGSDSTTVDLRNYTDVESVSFAYCFSENAQKDEGCKAAAKEATPILEKLTEGPVFAIDVPEFKVPPPGYEHYGVSIKSSKLEKSINELTKVCSRPSIRIGVTDEKNNMYRQAGCEKLVARIKSVIQERCLPLASQIDDEDKDMGCVVFTTRWAAP